MAIEDTSILVVTGKITFPFSYQKIKHRHFIFQFSAWINGAFVSRLGISIAQNLMSAKICQLGEGEKMDRRVFIKSMGLVMIGIKASAGPVSRELLECPDNARSGHYKEIRETGLLADAKRETPDEFQSSYLRYDGIITHSMGFASFDHYHELVIPFDYIRNPPNEVKILTEEKLLHTHPILLTRSDLKKIAEGKVVCAIDSTIREHIFYIYLPGGYKVGPKG